MPTPQETALANFWANLQDGENTYVQNECDVSARSISDIAFGNTDIQGCKGLVINSCNESKTQILSCKSEFLYKQAADAVMSVYTGAPNDIVASFLYLIDQSNSPDIHTRTVNYLKSSCGGVSNTLKRINVGPVKGVDCNNNIFNLYNHSTDNIQCVMGSIADMFAPAASAPGPGPGPTPRPVLPPEPAPAPAPFLTHDAIPVVAGVAAAVGVLIIGLIVIKVFQKRAVQPLRPG